MIYNDSVAIVDDMPLLSQWIKKSRSSERDFLAGMARFEGSAFGLLRKQPIVFGFAEGVRTSLECDSQQEKKVPSNDDTFFPGRDGEVRTHG